MTRPCLFAWCRAALILVGIGCRWMITSSQTALFAQESAVASRPSIPPISDSRRSVPLRNLDSYFPFDPPISLDAWKSRSEVVRRRVRFAAGQWPPLARPQAQGVIHDRVERDGYSVEKVYLESYPGHFVTGSLYRPRNIDASENLAGASRRTADSKVRRPAVLCPHGHWENGRFHAWSDEELKQQIERGAESLAVGGRYPLQARCVQLARMGCIVFLYDMVGYADSQQVSSDVIHGWRLHRPEMEGPTDWGFFSTQAELNLVTPFALQTFNSLMALDWICSLPDVDATRIGITGASGGGTQTFILAAIDPRPAVSVPVVMVSTGMQGGCPCENGPCLRIDTGNVEIAGLFAPKPLGLISANDWTVELNQKGFPELQRLYGIYQAESNVSLASLTQFEHNYNSASRTAMYSWMNHHLRLGIPEPIVEQEFVPLNRDEMSVWTDKHPAPEKGLDYERKLCRQIHDAQNEAFSSLKPSDPSSLARFQSLVAGAVEVIVSRDLPTSGLTRVVEEHTTKADGYTRQELVIEYVPAHEVVRATEFVPSYWNQKVVVWLTENGEQACTNSDGSMKGYMRAMLDEGNLLVAARLFGGIGQDEPDDGTASSFPRFVPTDRDIASYTFGYNRCLVAQQTCDILTMISALQARYPGLEQITICASGEPAVACALSTAYLRDVEKYAFMIQSNGFRFKSLLDWHDRRFVPGGGRYGDLDGFLALAAPCKMLLVGETPDAIPLVCSAYQAVDAMQNLEVVSTGADEALVGTKIKDWIRK